jgi:lysophospholipase L1-like esterase
MRNFFLLLTFLFQNVQYLSAQDAKTAWDNTIAKYWPEGFYTVEIKSTADSQIQKAIFYKSQLPARQPLIVSLHTWSGDYLQEDPLAAEVVLRGWNYIHPDFRGSNNNPEACGSERVISDLEDAIRFAISNGNIDTTEVHIIGASGGGYATFLAFMKMVFPVKSFSAWASIADLEDWYWECKGRNLKYAIDLEGVTTNGLSFDPVEAQRRSPLSMPFPSEKRKNASLFIYAGIHDGYTGSVPITHSINMFNKLLADMYPEQKNKEISDRQQIELLAKRTTSKPETNLIAGGRKVHLIRELPHLSLTIFEGSHEMIVPQALALIPVYGRRNLKKLNILTIGDSNAAAETGWPNQLKKQLPFSTVINKSVPGNTIGFDNLDQEKLNALKNIDRYLVEAYAEFRTDCEFDNILIGLGTNDTKREFEKRQKEVPENLTLLIEKIRHWCEIHQKKVPEIVIISPPPMDDQKANAEKYGGGDARIQKNNEQFRKVAKASRVDFMDIYTTLKAGISEETTDGVHLTEKAQFQLAHEIANFLNPDN